MSQIAANLIELNVCDMNKLLCCTGRWSGRNHREKIGVHVAFDQVLNIKPYCCTGSGHSVHRGGYTYDLSAVVMHHGKGFGSGHYTAYCYNTEGGENGGQMRCVASAASNLTGLLCPTRFLGPLQWLWDEGLQCGGSVQHSGLHSLLHPEVRLGTCRCEPELRLWNCFAPRCHQTISWK